jgi:hypothetical protein
MPLIFLFNSDVEQVSPAITRLFREAQGSFE